MLNPNEPFYSYSRPPVMPIAREVEFKCAVCGRLGFGPHNTKVHRGACHSEWTRRIAKRTAERNRRKRVHAAAREHACLR